MSFSMDKSGQPEQSPEPSGPEASGSQFPQAPDPQGGPAPEHPSGAAATRYPSGGPAPQYPPGGTAPQYPQGAAASQYPSGAASPQYPSGAASPQYPPPSPYGAPPQQYNPYGYGGYGPPPPEHPQASTILILGILSLVMCGICGPFAWSMGNKALKEIDASGGALGGRGNVRAGQICGIIGTAGLLIGVVVFVLWIVLVLILAAGSVESTPSTW